MRTRPSTRRAAVCMLLALAAPVVPTVASAQRIPLEAPPLPLHLECSVGADDGPPEVLFGRVNSVALDERGDLYVLDNMAQVVRVYDASCRHLRSFGRRGGGPGEFEMAVGVTVSGDSLIVFDITGHGNGTRHLAFTTGGRFLGELADKSATPGLCCGYTSVETRMSRGSGMATTALLLVRATGEDTVALINTGTAFAWPRGEERQARPVGDYGRSATPGPMDDTLLVLIDGYRGTLTRYVLSDTAPPRASSTRQLPLEGPELTAADHRRNREAARKLFAGRAELVEPDRWSIAANARYDHESRIWVGTADPSFVLVVPLDSGTARPYRLPDGLRLLTVTLTHLVAVTTTDAGAPVVAKYRYDLRE